MEYMGEVVISSQFFEKVSRIRKRWHQAPLLHEYWIQHGNAQINKVQPIYTLSVQFNLPPFHLALL